MFTYLGNISKLNPRLPRNIKHSTLLFTSNIEFTSGVGRNNMVDIGCSKISSELNVLASDPLLTCVSIWRYPQSDIYLCISLGYSLFPLVVPQCKPYPYPEVPANNLTSLQLLNSRCDLMCFCFQQLTLCTPAVLIS